MEQTIYFEEYEIGSVRESIGRTITETDIVLHAGQTGDFFPHHMVGNLQKPLNSENVSPTAHSPSPLQWA